MNGMRQIDLNGPSGNAFALIGVAERFAKQLEYDTSEITKMRDKMMSGDYANLIEVFEEHFGNIVELINKP